MLLWAVGYIGIAQAHIQEQGTNTCNKSNREETETKSLNMYLPGLMPVSLVLLT